MKPLRTIDDLSSDPHNANRGTPRGGALLDRALDEVGAGRAPVTDADGVVLAGNKTIEKWRAKGGKVKFVESDGSELVVVVRTDLNLARAPKKARALAYLDNQTAAVNLAWDPQVIEADRASGVVDFVDVGIFTSSELAGVLAAIPKPGVDDADRDADSYTASTTTTIKAGDIFALGKHRILCGDSTKRGIVQRLMNGRVADLMFTDPPYGVVYKSKRNDDRPYAHQGLHSSRPKTAIVGDLSQSTIPLSFAVAVECALSRDARVYLCGGQDNAQMYLSLFDHHLRMMPRFIIWDKGQFVLRRNNYHSQFEIVYFGWRGKGGGPAFWFGDRKQADVWSVKRDASADYVHPTQKPVELARRALANSCPHGGLVFEPFSGSGSTLIASEEIGRVCYALESDPLYVQTTIDRWQALTKKKAVQTGDRASGLRFKVAAGRKGARR